MAGNGNVALSEDSQVALSNSDNEIALPQQESGEVVVAGGHFGKVNFGPQTNKQVNQEPSTSHSQAQPSAKRRRTETPQTDGVDYTHLSDDILMYNKKPLKPGKKIYTGFQSHASGHKRPLAIKLLLPYTEKNLKEVRHLLKLAYHPNVVQIIHSREHQTPVRALYIAMELCKSRNLQDYLKYNRENDIPFDFAKTMSHSKQLIKGMKHIHRNRIVHRDLKPENILFSCDSDRIKVSDFGISKELPYGRSVTKQTTPGQGTDGYRAPETYNDDVISMSADIYSLGLTLYSLWTNGKHPFGDEPDLLNYNIKKNKNRDLSGLPERMGSKKREFMDLLSKMLEFDPKKRLTIEQVSKHPFFSNAQAGPVAVSLNEQQSPRISRVQFHPRSCHLSERSIPLVDGTSDEASTSEQRNREVSTAEVIPEPAQPTDHAEETTPKEVRASDKRVAGSIVKQVFRLTRPRRESATYRRGRATLRSSFLPTELHPRVISHASTSEQKNPELSTEEVILEMSQPARHAEETTPKEVEQRAGTSQSIAPSERNEVSAVSAQSVVSFARPPCRSDSVQKLQDLGINVSILQQWKVSCRFKLRQDCRQEKVQILRSMDQGYRMNFPHRCDARALQSTKVTINGRKGAIFELQNIYLTQRLSFPNELNSIIGKFWPGIVVWFDNKTLKAFAINFCNERAKFSNPFGGRSGFLPTPVEEGKRGKQVTIFSVDKFLRWTERTNRRDSTATQKGVKIWFGEPGLGCIEFEFTPSVISHFE